MGDQKDDVKELQVAVTALTTTERARLGGLKVSENRAHMSEIGRRGAASLLAKYGPDYFAELGRKRKKANLCPK